jgi:hypothetical protein
MITLLLLSVLVLRAEAPDTMLVEQKVLGSFQRATRLITNPQGWIYVLDSERNLVVLIKGDKEPSSSVGGYGWSSTTFDQPTGLATDGLNLYVADRGNHRIMRFDRSFNFISSFTTRDTSLLAARFGSPLGVALSRLGDLFVLDGENLRVVKFAANMQYERSFGDIDDERSRLRQPVKILISPHDRVFVLESDRLLEFDYFGQYLRAIGHGSFHDARGFCLVRGGIIVVTPGTLFWFNDRGELLREIGAAEIGSGSSIGAMEDLVVSDDRLLLLTSTQLHVIQILISSK